jgi:hypothetical protein
MSVFRTSRTHPGDSVVGLYWGAHSIKHGKTQVYFCDSYDPAIGYWMTNLNDATDRVNISERAPWRTWWPAEDKGTYYYIMQWA